MLRLALLLAVLIAFPAAAEAGNSMTTPSRGISCAVFDNRLRCDVNQIRWTNLPPKPKSCPFDWAGAVGLSATGRARHLCVSDAVDRGTIVPYGRTWRFGAFRCAVRRSGVTCTNRAGHGFAIARERFRFF